MPSTEQKNTWSAILLFCALAIPFILLYFASTGSDVRQSQVTGKEFDYGGRPVQPMSTKGQIILPLNERIILGRNGLVYKGLEGKKVLLDFYLLDLDDEQPFRKKFVKKDAKKEMKLGSTTYRLVSANKHLLIMKTQKDK